MNQNALVIFARVSVQNSKGASLEKMFKFRVQTAFTPVPYNIKCVKYKIKRNFLTLVLPNSKVICFNMNKLEMFTMEEET